MSSKIVNQNYRTYPISELQPHPDNPRKSNMHVLKDSVANNGFYGAVIIQAATKRIIAGEHRWRAAKAEGLPEIPVIEIDCSDEEAKRLLLVDNRSSDLGDHEEGRLDKLLEELSASRRGLTGTGFGPQNLRPSTEREGKDEKYKTVKSWDATKIRVNAIFSFSAPVEFQAKIRAVLAREFPALAFHESIAKFEDGEEAPQ
jgi:hypothetical protein